MGMSGGVAIYQLLKSNTDITDIVGSGDDCRIYPLVNTQEYEIPYIVYSTVYTKANATKSGVSTLDEVTYQIDIVTLLPSQTTALAELVRETLDYATYNSNGVNVQQIYFTDQRDQWNSQTNTETAFMIQQDYTLMINR